MSATLSVIPYYQIINTLDEFIRKNSFTYHDWYVGLAVNVEENLFNEHQLNPETDVWIFKEIPDEKEGVRIREYFLNMGCVSGISDMTDRARYVYLYRRSSKSNP
jgi:hypothetical protein